MKKKQIWANIFRYKLKSIFVRNVVSNIVFITIPLILFSSLVYWNGLQIVEKEISEISSTSLVRNRDIFDSLLKKIDYVSVTFARLSDVSVFLSSGGDVVWNSQYNNDILRILKTFVLADDYIDSIYIFSEKKQVIITMGGIFPLSTFSDTNWIDPYRNSSDILPFRISRRLFDDMSHVISVIKPIQNLETMERLGAVVINISLNRMATSVVSKNMYDELAVVGDNDMILFSDNPEYIGRTIDDIPEAEAYRSMIIDRQNVKYYHDQSYMLLYEKSMRDSIFYLMKIPLDHFQTRFQSVWRMFILLIILSFLISLSASIFLAINSYKPIDRLLDFIKNPEKTGKGQFKTEEIREIASSLLMTINTNRSLKEELVGKLLLIEKTRISALQAQINPHFLYNTLDVIRWSSMEQTGGENDVSEMIASLARLLRLSLETSDNIVTVREETEHAALFYRLLSKRYPGKFRMEWDIDKAIEDCSILKLCLQPLIENACYHGIKPTRRRGLIRVEGKKDKDTLHFRVIDNGKGVPEEEIDYLNRYITESLDFTDQHIGLKNVNQRIKLVFGEAWGLTISSDKGTGTIIDIYFPFIDNSGSIKKYKSKHSEGER